MLFLDITPKTMQLLYTCSHYVPILRECLDVLPGKCHRASTVRTVTSMLSLDTSQVINVSSLMAVLLHLQTTLYLSVTGMREKWKH